MWHPLKRVAENQRLDVDDFIDFATSNAKLYHLVNEYGYYEVSTFNVDKLIKDFENDRIRRRESSK